MTRLTSLGRCSALLALVAVCRAFAQDAQAPLPAQGARGPSGAAGPETAAAETETEPLPRYQIEVIVFAHSDGDPNEELFDHDRVTDEPGDGRGSARFLAIETFGDPARDAAPGRFGQPQEDGRFPGEPPEPGSDAGSGAAGGGPLGAEAGSAGGLATGESPASAGPFEFIDPFGRLSSVAAGTADDEDDAFAFRLLSSDELQLRNSYAAMDRLGAYRVLGHGGWIQDGLDEDSAQPFDLSYLGITNPRGTLKLYLGGFLHVAVDLEYRDTRVAGTSTGGSPPFFDSLSELELAPRYRLRTERNAIRSGELHYIDHPIFGVLLLITPAPEEEEPSFDDTDVLAPAA